MSTFGFFPQYHGPSSYYTSRKQSRDKSKLDTLTHDITETINQLWYPIDSEDGSRCITKLLTYKKQLNDLKSNISKRNNYQHSYSNSRFESSNYYSSLNNLQKIDRLLNTIDDHTKLYIDHIEAEEEPSQPDPLSDFEEYESEDIQVEKNNENNEDNGDNENDENNKKYSILFEENNKLSSENEDDEYEDDEFEELHTDDEYDIIESPLSDIEEETKQTLKNEEKATKEENEQDITIEDDELDPQELKNKQKLEKMEPKIQKAMKLSESFKDRADKILADLTQLKKDFRNVDCDLFEIIEDFDFITTKNNKIRSLKKQKTRSITNKFKEMDNIFKPLSEFNLNFESNH